MGIDIAKLSDSIVQDYFGNYYDCECACPKSMVSSTSFFLPPSISLGNKPLTPEEQKMKRKAESDVAFDKLYTAVYQTDRKGIFEVSEPLLDGSCL